MLFTWLRHGESQDALPPNLTQTDRERRGMRGRILLWQLIFSIYSASADWNCKFTIPNVGDYDLSRLAGEHTVERTRSTPPTSMIDRIIFDVCNELDQSQTPEPERVRVPLTPWPIAHNMYDSVLLEHGHASLKQTRRKAQTTGLFQSSLSRPRTN